MNKDTSIYSSNDDEISQLIIRIQDQMKEVQAEKEDKETLAKQKRCQEQTAIKTTTTIITMSLKQAMVAFQLFLQEHQACVKQQQAKKE